MQQRRTPGGQRPLRRPGQAGRSGAARPVRAGGVRAESRATDSRSPGTVRGADGARSANRPAVRRSAPGGAVKRLSAPRPRWGTGRATVLVAVLVALALGYTYPVRVYLDQQADIARMEAAQAAQRAEIEELAAEAAKWQDQKYLEAKVRERFFMGREGEQLLIVLPNPPGEAEAADQPAGDGLAGADRWYETLWSSVTAADQEPSGE
ncbi:septum formation initiator family protein [Salinispora cortesiana]|uniref:septum formation initiator family protein n=1 Tax=Salinispora cortesiana TaxID=1305843 RepID=UPI000471E5AF|nr:septum formation initiator family protein [Salinispora cortesiana]